MSERSITGIKEFIIMPVGANSYSNALEMTTEINEHLRELVVEKCGILATNVLCDARGMLRSTGWQCHG